MEPQKKETIKDILLAVAVGLWFAVVIGKEIGVWPW